MERQLAVKRDVRAGCRDGRWSRGPARRGFTLIEILVTLAIIALLTVLTMPALTSMLDGSAITQGGQYVADEVNLARQVSAAQNITVELRLFKLAGATLGGYTALQLWNPATNVSLHRPIFMPTNVAIAENSGVLSPALADAPITTMLATQGGPFAGATYVAFEIRPSGVVTPVMNATQETNFQQYSLMVVLRRYAVASNATAPKDFTTVQINPLTATPIIYRP